MVFENAKRRYIQEKARFNKGYAEVSFVKGIYETFVMLFIATTIIDYHIPKILYVVLPIVCVFGMWLLGYFWDKTHMFHISTEFGNERNYFVKEVRKVLKSNKRKL